MPTTLKDRISTIKTTYQPHSEFGLKHIAPVAKKMQLCRFKCPVITVAGTNGKGSCVKTLETIYAEAGFKTGVYTSPHLSHFNERIRIGNKDIDDAALISAFEHIEESCQDTRLSFFEFVTVTALWLFQQADCDVLILEIGLGGRLDAVNIVENDVAVVTSISLDHMETLGSDRNSIAYEKSSIARENKILICGDEDPPPKIAETVHARKATLYQMKRDFDYVVKGSHMECWGKDFRYKALPSPRLKPQNIATALMVINHLQDKLPVPEEAIFQGVEKVFLPGRFEQHTEAFVLDVAHNPASAAWLATQLSKLPRVKKTAAVIGMLDDKAMEETVKPLLPFIDDWYVAKLSIDRGSDGAVIRDFLKAQDVKNCYTFESVSDALDALHRDGQTTWDRALIFGSFHTVSDAKVWLSGQGDHQWKKKSNKD